MLIRPIPSVYITAVNRFFFFNNNPEITITERIKFRNENINVSTWKSLTLSGFCWEMAVCKLLLLFMSAALWNLFYWLTR